MRILMPREKWVNKLLELKAISITQDESGNDHWRMLPRGKLQNKPDIEILGQVNSEVRGFYRYYQIAENVSTLNSFSSCMKRSMLKTFGSKYRCRVRKIQDRYVRDGKFSVQYQTRTGPKTSVYYDKGFKRNPYGETDAKVDIVDRYVAYAKPSSLYGRISRGICELCGEESKDLIFHQVRKLKDLSDDRVWKQRMKAMRRKTLAVCPACYEIIRSQP